MWIFLHYRFYLSVLGWLILKIWLYVNDKNLKCIKQKVTRNVDSKLWYLLDPMDLIATILICIIGCYVQMKHETVMAS